MHLRQVHKINGYRLIIVIVVVIGWMYEYIRTYLIVHFKCVVYFMSVISQ